MIHLQNQLLEAERNRVLTETAGATAHEINQPLTALVGMSEFLMNQTTLDDQTRDCIETLHKASQRISKIVNQMKKTRQYTTKPYFDDINIIDFDAAASDDKSDT